MNSTRLSLIILILIAGAPGAAEGDAVKKEVAGLQGTWRVVAMEDSGRAAEEEEITRERHRLIVEGDRFTLTVKGDVGFAGTFKVVELKGKVRKTDLTFMRGFGAGATVHTLAERIDDDTFRTCIGIERRPDDFTTNKENGRILITFKREKK